LTEKGQVLEMNFIIFDSQKLEAMKTLVTTEFMTVKDRFYFNQFFPIGDNLSEEFLKEHVGSAHK
jgi:hypothetical protein